VVLHVLRVGDLRHAEDAVVELVPEHPLDPLGLRDREREEDVLGGLPVGVTQLAAATMTVVPVLIVFLIAQRQFVESLAHSELKG
jgi:hypothetical protein